MTYLSVCSGIEAASVAWHPLGWTPVAFSEIEPFPCAVLAHHYPGTPNLGDMNGYKEWDIGAIDLLVGGTPCQSFSVAGLRKGLDDPRGNLMLVYLAIARRFAPRWVVWENVPGVLSSGGGRDFGTFLGGLAECGYGFAYRVLDAQFFGVPQRRRRVFVVGYLGDWRPAAAVLFERESLRGYPPPSREAGERVAGTIDGSAHPGGYNGQDAYNEKLIAFAQNQRQEVRELERAGALAGIRRGDAKNETLIAHSLRAEQHASEDGTGRGTPLVAGTLFASGAGMERPSGTASEASFCVPSRTGVRRLTPRECERLQGFPDDYTLIPWRRGMSASLAPKKLREPAGIECPDDPRYKALGDSMAVPCMGWLGRRIERVNGMVA